MALVEKNDIKQIFADQAPSIDKPASFANYPRGWDTARPNNGKPTIKQFNYLQQRTDQNFLWMHQNGAALPYDAAMEYAEGAVVVKDGKLQQKQGNSWVSAANKGYNLDYFVGGKSYPLHAEIMLENGDIVKSTVVGNTVDPNVNMDGWSDKVGNAYQVIDASGLDQQQLNNLHGTPFQFGAIGDGTHHPLSERYPTLASAQLVYPHATSLADSIDWCAVQAFFNYSNTNIIPNASWSGSFSINKPLDRVGNSLKTQTITGCLRLTATAPMLYMLRTAGAYCSYGDMSFFGKNLAKIGHYNGDSLGGVSSSICCTFGRTYIDQCTWGGVFNGNNTMFSTYKQLRIGSCGYKAKDIVPFSFISNGTNADVNQYSELSVSIVPDYPLTEGILSTGSSPTAAIIAEINGKPYQVIAKDEVNKTIRIRPRLLPAETGTLKYYYGAAFHSVGANGSCISVENASFTNCGLGLSSAALYTMYMDQLTTESCGVGFVLGRSRSDAAGNFVLPRGYFEANDWDYIEIATPTVNLKGVTMLSNVSIKPEKMYYLGTNCWIKSNGEPNDTRFNNATINIKGTVYSSLENSFARISLADGIRYTQRYANSGSISIAYLPDINRLFGENSISAEIIGAGRNGSPTGTITFNPPEGYTINGQASLVIPAQNMGSLRVSFTVATLGSTNIIASVLNNVDKIATVVYNPPSLAAVGTEGDSVTTTVALVGAILGDNVSVSFSQYNESVEISAQVSAANTVTVKFKNTSASAVDLASGTLRVKLI